MSRLELIAPLEIYQQMMSYVKLAKGEVTWFFDVSFDPDLNAFIMGKIYLLPQEASGAGVEMAEPEVANFLLKMMDEDIDQLPRGWGHSHSNMDTFFSTTDENTIEELDTGTFLVALVMNKRADFEATVKFRYADFSYRMNLELTVDYTLEEIPEKYKLEVEEKVKDRIPPPFKTFYKYGGQKYPAIFKGKKGKKKVDPDTDWASDSLDPVIQEQFKNTGSERGTLRIHEVPLREGFLDGELQDERICTKCWVMEDSHNSDPKSCGNPNYLNFEDSYDYKDSSIQ